MVNTHCLETWQDLRRDHLLPTPLKKAPGAWAGGSSEKALCWTQTCPSPCLSKSN